MKTRQIINSSLNPHYNVALDHVLLELRSRDKSNGIIRFWKNTPSVIVGRTQDIEVEVDTKYCEENDISVIRRISGGGSVYHDTGNLNISIILPNKIIPGSNVQEFSNYYTKMFSECLSSLGYPEITLEGRTNIFSQGRKISGSAGHLTRGWFLHHATLLFNADLEVLNRTLKARESYPEDPRKSRYFPTTNLVDFREDILKESVKKRLQEDVALTIEKSIITDKENTLTELFVKEMYTKDSWNIYQKRKFIPIKNS